MIDFSRKAAEAQRRLFGRLRVLARDGFRLRDKRAMDATAPQRPPKRLLRLLTTLLGVAIFLLILLWVGQWTRQRISGLDRYTVALTDIDCPPPPDQNRADFLAEIQYLGSLPDHLHLLDDNLTARLADAFARHPAVGK